MWKSSLKTGGHHAIFWVLEFKKSKNITKIKQKRLFLFTFLVSFFYGVSRAKTDLHYNIRFNFVFDSFFELDHVLNIYFRSLSEEMT